MLLKKRLYLRHRRLGRNVWLDSVERYNPSQNSLTFVSSFKMTVATFNGFLYVTGGAVLEDGDGIDLVQCFDPKSDKWSLMAPMLIARLGSAAFVRVGTRQQKTRAKSSVFDPIKNEWSVKASMNERRYRPGVAVVDGKIYVCGGEEGWDRYHDTVECYDE
uniref:Uncharacterized protein n=1 Tax=Strigamia maritima TaxID=126957 RepID=T1IU73_STRMM